jgi:hypothetical protein
MRAGQKEIELSLNYIVRFPFEAGLPINGRGGRMWGDPDEHNSHRDHRKMSGQFLDRSSQMA